MLSQLCLLAVLCAATCDVSHLETSTLPPPPRPYAFSYTAGRFPGHSDRHHAEVSDGSGVVRGTFSYVDPGHKVRRVDYVADQQGFHPVLSETPPDHPADTKAVAAGKQRHHQLYEQIAADHASYPHPQGEEVPLRQSAAVLPPPARPYAFSYTAGRFPGHSDRHHAEVSDGSGAVRGTFSYVDPGHKVRRVDYVADQQGFHPVLSEAPPDHPADTKAVAAAKQRHHQLYEQIAADHASSPHPQVPPRQSAAVLAAAEKHASLFRVIAEQHARIAAEREELQDLEHLEEY